jgi:hypothetical protein
MHRVVLVWTDGDRTQRTSKGKIEDVSDGGMCVRVNDPIQIGSKLLAHTPLGNFQGTVVRSRQEGQGRVLGIKRDTEDNGEGN